MRAFGIFLIIFGTIIIYFPEIIAYLLGGLLVFIGFNLLGFSIFTKKKNGDDNYVKFGNYKIFR
ncbi:MAG: hypothetical protein PHV23_02085 [Candidatus Gracilibacteria bacterium]|nr:hypothetical protein [Candidatus Gracilibacteria bacterium]